ncbi:MAG TPA: type II toxin-antitoxin system prevent-host-death family antitoxin [Luteimonas sp.]|nr:type II toxin-antitoxin system prevent-host-death family antitoxin [Luteimonas sp.]
MTQVNILEAKTRLSELVKAAQAGEEVVIANRGVPVARLVKLAPPQEPGLGDPKAILDWLKKNPAPKHSRRSKAQIDAAIAEERDSWD